MSVQREELSAERLRHAEADFASPCTETNAFGMHALMLRASHKHKPLVHLDDVVVVGVKYIQNVWHITI